MIKCKEGSGHHARQSVRIIYERLRYIETYNRKTRIRLASHGMWQNRFPGDVMTIPIDLLKKSLDSTRLRNLSELVNLFNNFTMFDDDCQFPRMSKNS